MSASRPLFSLGYRLFPILILLPLTSACRQNAPLSTPGVQESCELVVLTSPNDPYKPLAVEIASVENAPLAYSLEQALRCNPHFLLWVASPDSLSDETMVAFGLALKAGPGAVSSGLISGSTIDLARELWLRGDQVRTGVFYAANAPNPSSLIFEGRLRRIDNDCETTLPLSRESFSDALQKASYLTFTGHGGSSSLGLSPEIKFASEEIPSLNGALIGTGSCQTFRPWRPDSIALRFTDNGAAAYTGFTFSPNEGYLIGEFDGLPLRYTTPDFPVGHVIQVQNHGALQGFAHFPYLHLLGDPRTALQTGPVYRLVADRQEGRQRILTYQDLPPGLVPIRVENGAGYLYVDAVGITHAATNDPFYNSRLQMADIRGDKYLLVDQQGGQLTLRLSHASPWYWFPLDILLDSFDHTLIFSQQSDGDLLAAGFAVFPAAWVLWQAFKRRLSWAKIRRALYFGLGAATLTAVYAILRVERATIISKSLAYNPSGTAVIFVLGVCGALIYLQSITWRGKAAALLVSTFFMWAPMLFGLSIIAGMNLLFARPQIGAPIYNYNLGLLPLPAFILSVIVAALILRPLSGKQSQTGLN